MLICLPRNATTKTPSLPSFPVLLIQVLGQSQSHGSA